MGIKRVISSDEDKPLLLTGVAVSLLCGALAAGLGAAIDTRTAAFSLLVGALLGFIAALVPVFLALRLIALVGLLMVGAAAVALAVKDQPVLAGLAMAALAFAAAIWAGLPIVGMLMSALPVLVFVLIVAKSQEITSGAPVASVVLAGLLGAVPPTLVALALSSRDFHKADRGMAAAIWQSKEPSDDDRLYARLLILNGAPSPLLDLVGYGFVSRLARAWLVARSTSGDSAALDPAALDQGDSNASAVAAALVPKGKLFPRKVTLSTDAMAAQVSAQSGQTSGAAWEIWLTAERQGAAVLEGNQPRRLTLHPLLLMMRALVGSLLRPDASVFRYGVQRALALGVGIAALVASKGNQDVFWVVITLVAVLQSNAPSTLAKVARRTAGTFGGVLVALLVSYVVPASVLVPWVAILVLLAGLAWMSRNYFVTAMASAFGVVLLYGAPKDDVVGFAAARAIDVVIGGIIAALVARLVLPVRPRLEQRRADIVAALQTFSSLVRRGISDPQQVSTAELARAQADVARSTSNLRTDLKLVSDDSLGAAYKDDLRSLESVEGQLFVLVVTQFNMQDEQGLSDLSGLDAQAWIDQRLAELAAAPPESAATK